MTKASDNAFPSILITEGTEPSAPAAGKQRLYIDSTTHKLKRTDSSGVDVTIEAAAGAVATDTIWDAAGDLVVGTGADTAAKLVKGNAGAELAMGNGAVIWNAGTSFPASKATNDRYWRTDIAGGMGFHWDGANWVSDTLYQATMEREITSPTTSSGVIHRWAHPGNALALDIWIIDLETTFDVSGGTALSGSHKWVGTFEKIDASNTSTTVVTVTIDSGSSSVWRKDKQTIGAAFDDATYYTFRTNWTKTGTPGQLYALANVAYRLIAT